jgi:hypothetical protein
MEGPIVPRPNPLAFLNSSSIHPVILRSLGSRISQSPGITSDSSWYWEGGVFASFGAACRWSRGSPWWPALPHYPANQRRLCALVPRSLPRTSLYDRQPRWQVSRVREEEALAPLSAPVFRPAGTYSSISSSFASPHSDFLTASLSSGMFLNTWLRE